MKLCTTPRLVSLTALCATVCFAGEGRAWAPPLEPACPAPELWQCQDRSYLDSDCGQTHLSTCGQLLGADYHAQWSAADHATPMLPAQGLNDTGQLVPGVHQAFDPSTIQMIYNAESTYAGTAILDSFAQTTVAALPVWMVADTWRKHPAWEANGTQMASCGEYVYEKYYDYSRFEDIALRCGEDFDCVYNMAFLPSAPGIASRTLVRKDGSPMVPQIEPAFRPRSLAETATFVSTAASLPKNVFFSADLSILQQDSRYAYYQAEIDGVLAALQDTPKLASSSMWAWHKARAESQPPDLSAAERRDVDARVAGFKKLLDDYAKISAFAFSLEGQVVSAALQPQGSGGINMSYDCYYANECDDGADNYVELALQGYGNPNDPLVMYGKARVALFDAVLAEWQRGPNGCFGAQYTVCDWSPRELAKLLLSQLQPERETDFQRCLQAGFPSDPAHATGIAPLEAFIEQRIAQQAAEAASLPPFPGTPPGEPKQEVGQRVSGGKSLGDPDWIAAGYSYDAGWQLVPIEKSGSNVCRIGGTAWGSVKASATLLGEEYSFIDAGTYVGVWGDNQARHHTHFKLMNDDLYQPGNEKVPVPQGIVSFDHSGVRDLKLLDEKKAIPTPIFGIPIMLHVWVDAQFRSKVHAEAEVPTSCGAQTLPFRAVLDAETRARLDAHGSASVGIPGFQAGVKGDVNLVRAELPLHAAMWVSGQNGDMTLHFETNSRLGLDELSGHLSVFAEYIFDKTEHEIFSWKGLHQDVPLWDFKADVLLVSFGSLPANPSYMGPVDFPANLPKL